MDCWLLPARKAFLAWAAVALSLLGGAELATACLTQPELPPPPETAPGNGSLEGAPAAGAAPVVRGQSGASEPERIVRLQRTIEADKARLEALKCLVDDPQSDYAKAERAFKELDTQLAERKRAAEDAARSGNLAAAELARGELLDVERKWSLARNEFQLAFDERKAQQASIATLQEKITKDEAALDRLRGQPTARLAGESAPTGVPDPPPPPPVTAPQPARIESAATMQSLLPPHLKAVVASGEAQDKARADEGTPKAEAAKAETGPPSTGLPSSVEAVSSSKKKSDERLEAATKAAAESQQEVVRAEDEASHVSERLDVMRRDIALQRQLRQVADSKVDVASQQLAELNAELERKIAAESELNAEQNADPERKVAAREAVTQVRRQIREAENRMIVAQQESREIAERLDALQTELGTLQAEELAALRAADAARLEAQLAENLVAALKNPLAWENVRHWLLENGLAILSIVGIISVILWAGQMLEQRIVLLIAGRSPRGGRNERENRARTLVSVLHNIVRIVAIAVGAIMILDQVGLPIGPLVGGAAVVGLAVAFGAQSLIKDYFTGFMVLLEQQYMIDDVVKIGDTAGQVERITLRMTVLRDIEGRVHFIPHGQINSVTNLTHGWSRAVFDIGVAYKENVDRVIEVLMELAFAMKADEKYGLMILEDPVMMGVDAFGDSAVVVRFAIKTRPLRQWEIKRELLRRIKNRFDELGIEIPFPHRTLYFGNPPAKELIERGSDRDSGSRA